MDASQCVEVVRKALQPVNVSGALLIVQVCLLIIISIGLILDGFGDTRKHSSGYISLIFLAIVSIVVVAFINEFYPIWSPILGEDIKLPTLKRNSAFFIAFLSDIIVIWTLIIKTGGSSNSPFTPILFLIPTLSIFLRQSPSLFISYAVIIFWLYLISDKKYNRNLEFSGGSASKVAHKFVNFACLSLGLIIGFITRPVVV